jgi:ribosome maturation factor RimP
VAVTPAGKRRLVRIWLDRDLADLAADDENSMVEPLSLDEVADATRIIGAALDDSDALGEAPYVLEIGSVGVDRPLTSWRHFRRNVTRLVEISPTSDAAGAVVAAGDPSSPLTGRLIAAERTGVTVLVAATKSEPETKLRIAYDDIARAQVQVEFAHVTAERVTKEEES